MPPSDPETFRIEGVAIDLRAETVTGADGQPIALRPQSFAVLRHLAENAGRLVTKDELMRTVWPVTAVTDDSLVQCVGDVRRALGPAAARLKTLPRRGYRLDLDEGPGIEPLASTTALTAGTAPAPPADATALLPADLPVPAPSPPQPRRSWQLPNALRTRWTNSRVVRRGVLGSAGLLVVLLLAVLNVTAQSSAARSGPATLAVIPLSEIGDHPSLPYLAAGTTENLVTQLSRSPELRLVTAAPSGGEEDRSPAELGRAAGADYVLFGSVQREGEALRIVAHLVEAASGEHLWAERFDRAGSDPFQLQDEVTSETLWAIAGEDGLIRKRLYEDAWGRDAGDLAEYDYFLRGHDIFMRFTEADNEEARRIWLEGLEHYPDSGILAVKAGYAHFMRLQLGWTRDREADLAAAFALGRRGLAAPEQMPLSRTLGHMLMAELNFYAHDFEAAMRERAFVLELAPFDFFHRANLAYVAVGAGHPEEAVAALEGITPSRPLADFGYAALAWAQFALKDYRASIEAARAALQPVPVYAYAFEAASHAELGETAKAEAALRKLIAAEPAASLDLIRDLHPNADAEVLEREIDALRRLGLPERSAVAASL